MVMWNPWRGCHKYSEGCKFCYIHQGDIKRNIDTNKIVKTEQFDAPIKKLKNGQYKMKGGQIVYLCFSSDFLLEDADIYRKECWKMIKVRQDLHFIFLTKRITRLQECLPEDWQDGYDNVTIGCTIENQKRADERLPVFLKLPIKHRNIIAQPLLEDINIQPYLKDIELVVVGGEYHANARPFYFDWVLHLREQCINTNTHFEFRQLGTNFVKDNKLYKLSYKDLARLAKLAQLNF